MLLDYGFLKKKLRALCDELDELLLLPGTSPYIDIEDVSDSAVRVTFGQESDRDVMTLPKSDVLVLPVSNISGEELSSLLLTRFIESCGSELTAKQVAQVSIGVSSGPGQRVASTRRFVTNQPRSAVLRSQGTRSFSTLSTCTNGSHNGTAIVTGGSSGIGRATAQHFQEQGWTVHNVSRRPIDEPWVQNHLTDLQDADAVRHAGSTIASSLMTNVAGSEAQKVCVVHCAGIHAADSIDSVAHEEGGVDGMLQTFGVNVIAPAVISSTLLPAMGQGSSIVYVGSTLSEIGVAGRLSYVASKHAVVGLMRATVQDLFGRGIHTACVCPGFTDTPMIDQALHEQLGLSSEEVDATRKVLANMCSYGRFVQTQEIADLIAFVADNPALNGSVLHANLGQKQS